MTENNTHSETMDTKDGVYNGIQTSKMGKDNISNEDKNIQQRKRYRFKNRKKKKLSFDALSECRKMFRQEMIVLAKEVEQFRLVCDAQIDKYQTLVQEEKDKYKKVINSGGIENGRIKGKDKMEEIWKTQLDNLQADMDYLERKQLLLDKEQKLISKEDELSRKEKDLEEYEQEIEEVEHILDKRQSFCEKRQRDLDDLDEDLRNLKYEIQEEQSSLEKEGVRTESSERAKRNWEILRNKMMENQSDLESRVQKYKTDLATANSSIAAKDITITKLSTQVKLVTEELKLKDKKIKQLESRLALTIDEARNFKTKHDKVKEDSDYNDHAKLSPKSSLDSLENSLNRRRGSTKKHFSTQGTTISKQDISTLHRHDHIHLRNGESSSSNIRRRPSYSRTNSNTSTSSTCNVM